MYDSGPHLLFEAKQSSATNSAAHDSLSKAAATMSPSFLCGERKRDSANAHSIKWQVAWENFKVIYKVIHRDYSCFLYNESKHNTLALVGKAKKYIGASSSRVHETFGAPNLELNWVCASVLIFLERLLQPIAAATNVYCNYNCSRASCI
jgi:hypothetical protein